MFPFHRGVGCAHGGLLGAPEQPCWRCQNQGSSVTPYGGETSLQPVTPSTLGTRPGAVSLFRVSGPVRATQLGSRPPAGQVARGVAGVLLAVFVLTHWEMILLWITTQLFWLIVIGALLMVLGMGRLLGAGAGLVAFFVSLLTRTLPGPRTRDPLPCLRVRVETTAGDREFDLPGHEVGIQVGDRVQATTLPRIGGRRAVAVRNLSTNSTFRARRAGGVLFPALLVLLLVSIW